MSLLQLEDDLLRTILCFLRRDPHGNETVPGLIFENRVWRQLAKRFLGLSRDTPSAYDAAIAFTHRMIPCMFGGGLRCSQLTGNGTPARHLFLARDRPTGRIYALLTEVLHDTALLATKGALSMLSVNIVLSLAHLVQLLSGQNADYDTRLDHFDSIVVGRNVSMGIGDSIAGDQQSVTGEFVPPRSRDVTRTVDVFVRWSKVTKSATMVSYLNALNLVIPSGDVKVTKLLTTMDTVDVSKTPQLPPISALLGFYDHAQVAECGGMQVGINTHRLPKELMPKYKPNDPGLYYRALGKAALDRAQRLETERSAIVLHGTQSAPGPSGVPARRPRSAATEAKTTMGRAIRVENDLLTTGRLTIARQMGDDDSREAEAKGFTDDQYAAPGEEAKDDILYDSDGEYRDGEAPRSKKQMAKERRAEAIAERVAKTAKWQVPSSDEEDVDDL
jgi:hypothetical protein